MGRSVSFQSLLRQRPMEINRDQSALLCLKKAKSVI